MTQLSTLSPANSYGDLLTTTNGGRGLEVAYHPVQDGLGVASTIEISTNGVNFIRTGGKEFSLDAVAVTATSTKINQVCGNPPQFLSTLPLQLPVGTKDQRDSITAVPGMIHYTTSADFPYGVLTAYIDDIDGGSWVIVTS